MRLMPIVVRLPIRDEVETVPCKAGVAGCTEVAAARGETGPRLGSEAHPERSTVLLTAFEPAVEERVRIALAVYDEAGNRRVRAFSWPVEEAA